MGEWKVYSQVIGSTRKYIAGRIIDITKPQHGGNMEYVEDMGYIEDKEGAERIANELNKNPLHI